MGIKDLNPLIKAEAPEAIIKVNAKKFSGTRVAFDMGIVMHKMYHRAAAEFLSVMGVEIGTRNPTDAEVITWWIRMTLDFFKSFLKNNILPVLVWDGKPCEHKNDTVADRAEKLEKAKNEVEYARAKFNNCVEGSMTRIAFNDLYNKMKNLNFISKENRVRYKEILTTIGFPSFQAKEEADPLCVALCLGYHTTAVYSSDSDMLTHGAPLLITEFNSGINELFIDWDNILFTYFVFNIEINVE